VKPPLQKKKKEKKIEERRKRKKLEGKRSKESRQIKDIRYSRVLSGAFGIVRHERSKPHSRIRSLRVAMDAIEKIYAVVRAGLESRRFQREQAANKHFAFCRAAACVFSTGVARAILSFPDADLG